MHSSYVICDGCHNCGWTADQLALVIPKDEGLLCGHEPIRERKLIKGVMRDVVKFAEVHPAGKCDEWRPNR